MVDAVSPPVSPDDLRRRVERHILRGPDWIRDQNRSVSRDGTEHRWPILSLSLTGASVEQRAAALEVLLGHGIAARVHRSESLGGIDVLRVESMDVGRLGVLRHISDPASWAENSKTRRDGARVPCLNVRVADETGRTDENHLAVSYALGVLRDLGVEAQDTVSASLGGIRVVRVEGQERIDRLRAGLAGLGPAPHRVPDYPRDTHIHTVHADGTFVVRLLSGTPPGKIDNPIGPAVSGLAGEKFALDGRIMDFREWSERTVRQPAPSP